MKKTLYVSLSSPNDEMKLETDVNEHLTSVEISQRLGVKRYRIRAWSRNPFIGSTQSDVNKKLIYRLSELPEIEQVWDLEEAVTGKKMIWVFKYLSIRELKTKRPSYLRTELK